jgi:hypothetical protein
MAAIILGQKCGNVRSIICFKACGIYLLMLPLVGSICTGATGRMAANHIHLNHGFIAVLWHRQWSTHFSYQLLTTFRVSVRLYAVCCQGLQQLWTPLASPNTWFCATLCWTVVKISHLLTDHFPHSGCFSFSIRMRAEVRNWGRVF